MDSRKSLGLHHIFVRSSNPAFLFVLPFHVRLVSESSRILHVWLPHFSRHLQDSDSDFQTVTGLTRVITRSGASGALCPFPKHRGMEHRHLHQYASSSIQRDEHACLNSHTIIAPTNIFDGRILLYLFNSSSSLPLAIGISVPAGVTTHYCLNRRPTQDMCLGILLLIPLPNSPQRAASCVRYAPFNSHASFFLGSYHTVFWGTPTRLYYEVPIECLKVVRFRGDSQRRLISTPYNTTPGRWRAPQSNLGNRDRTRRTTIYKRFRSDSSRFAIFLTETLRLRTTCVVRRKLLQFAAP